MAKKSKKLNWKNMALLLAAGFGVYWAYGQAQKQFPDMFKAWWSTPLAIALLGGWLARKPNTRMVGFSLIGAAGFAGNGAYQMNKLAVANTTETAGLQQASMRDVGGLQEADWRAN